MPASWHQGFEVRQQDDAFLFAGVGARDDRRAGSGSGVEGQVGYVGGDVDEVPGLGLQPVLEALAPVHHRTAGKLVDSGLVRGVLVGAGAAAGRDRPKAHADAGGADAFTSESRIIGESLLAGVAFGGADLAAFGRGESPAWVSVAYHGGAARAGEREGIRV